MSAAADCVFCAIVSGAHPAAVVASDDAAVAFLDARPVFKGHVLVVPRAHVPTLADLPGPAIGPFFTAVQKIAGAHGLEWDNPDAISRIVGSRSAGTGWMIEALTYSRSIQTGDAIQPDDLTYAMIQAF